MIECLDRAGDRTRFAEAIEAGDREALATAILALAQRIVLARRSILPRSLDLDDAVQEAAVRAFEGLSRWHPSDCPVNVWVWRAVEQSLMNQARSQIRWSRRHRELVTDR